MNNKQQHEQTFIIYNRVVFVVQCCYSCLKKTDKDE